MWLQRAANHDEDDHDHDYSHNMIGQSSFMVSYKMEMLLSKNVHFVGVW